MRPFVQHLQWVVPKRAPEAFIQHYAPLHPWVMQYLWNRSITHPEAVTAFIERSVPHSTDPMQMADMLKAVQRIWTAIAEGQPMLVFGDYDADGTTSTALLYEALQALGAQVNWYVPTRAEGYGLSSAALDRVEAKFGRPQVIVTVDNGISAKLAAQDAKDRGITLIVTDHHDINPSLYPSSAYAVVNPQRLDCGYPEYLLSGCTVAMKLAQALAQYALDNVSLKKHTRTDISLDSFATHWLDLAAISTVADLVSLAVPENRWIVHEGLLRIQSSPRPGIRQLLQTGRYPKALNRVNAETIGFSIAPALNAPGRIDDPKDAVHLLLASDLNAGPWAIRLLEANEERKRQKSEIAQQAIDQVSAYSEAELASMPVIVEYIPDCSEGLRGLVAADLVQHYGRPAVVVTDSERVDGDGETYMSASARSITGFNIASALRACSDLLASHGGHAAAAGFQVAQKDFEAFREKLWETAKSEMDSLQTARRLVVDALVPLSSVGLPLLSTAQLLEPCGNGMNAPLFVSQKLYVVEANSLGKDSTHLSMKVADDKGNTRDVIGWHKAGLLKNMPEVVDIVYKVTLSDFRGERIQLMLEALQPSNTVNPLQEIDLANEWQEDVLAEARNKTQSLERPKPAAIERRLR